MPPSPATGGKARNREQKRSEGRGQAGAGGTQECHSRFVARVVLAEAVAWWIPIPGRGHHDATRETSKPVRGKCLGEEKTKAGERYRGLAKWLPSAALGSRISLPSTLERCSALPPVAVTRKICII